MKRFVLLFLLVTAPVFAQQIVRPSTADYRYEEIQLPSSPDTVVTNWFIDFMYRDLPQGRTYRRQTSYNGRDWVSEGDPIVVADVPGATATFVDGINLRPPAGIQQLFFRLAVEPTNAAPAMKRAAELVEANQTEVRTWYGAKKKKLKKPFTINIPPNGRLTYTPTK